MRKVPKFVWAVFACLLCIVITAGVCLLRGNSTTSSDKYGEVIKVLQANFYTVPDTTHLEDASASAMVAALDDPWSYYMTAEEYAEYNLAATNQYIGIGITTEFNERYQYLAITSVAPGSPADNAHIKVGNMVAAVDNVDVSQYTPEELDALIRSYDEKEKDEDKYMTIHLLNTQGGKADAKVKCELIYMSPVTYYMVDKSLIGYVRISNFDDSTAAALKSAVSDLEKQGANSLILDVRDNQTGKPAELSESLDYLLGKCDMFVLRDQNAKENTYSSGNSHVELRTVVLINENTGCAAEIFAYCMQQYGNAKIVGRRTLGNSQSQVIVELSDGSAIRVSKYQYLTLDKKSLAEIGGVVPDVFSSQIEDSDMDVQLEAAIDAAS